MKIKGLWLFGLSGSGKTYLSKRIAKKIKNSFLIDGDQIRKLISFDLGYNIRDRVTSSKRNLGLAKIAIANKQFPIISGVYLDPKVYRDICKSNIRVINVVSHKKSDINKKLVYKKKVVGKSIKQPKFKCRVFINNYSKKQRLDILWKK
jgi:adenylylsulfate kinase-like enzyme